MNKYTCQRCSIRQGVKPWVFSEHGFRHQVNLCDCCASESGIEDKQIEFYEYLREQNRKEVQAEESKIQAVLSEKSREIKSL